MDGGGGIVLLLEIWPLTSTNSLFNSQTRHSMMLSIHIFLGFFFSMSALLLLLFSGGVNQSISTRFENENCEVRWKITKIIRTREIALLWNFGIEPNSFKATGSTTLKYSINYTLHTTSSTSLLDATPLGFNFFSFFLFFFCGCV